MDLPAAGEACLAADSGSQRCDDGLICDGADQKCHAVARLGQACSSDQGCASGLCQGGKCRRPEACELP